MTGSDDARVRRDLDELRVDGLTIWRTDDDGELRCRYANPVAIKTLSLPEPYSGARLSDLPLGPIRERWREAAARIRRGDDPLQVVDQVRAGDASWASSWVYAVDGVVAITFALLNALAWMDQNVGEDRYRSIIEAETPICRLDPQLNLTWVNDGYCRVYGRSREELIGVNVVSMIADPSSVQTIVAKIHEGNAITATTFDAYTPARGHAWFQFINYPICDESGELVEMLSVGTDITHIKKAEERQRELERQLQQKQRLEVLGKLAGGIAHDFNNLLTAAFGDLDRLPNAGHPAARGLRKTLLRSAELTRQLLAFSRGRPTRSTAVDLPELFSGLEALLERLLPESIDLSLPEASGVPAVRGTVGQLEQVLVNLVVNARDAMDGKGRITIDVGPAEGALVEAVRIRVMDSGPGVPPEHRERLFEPFFTTKPEGKGTGLGLAVVHGIVEQLEGAMSIEDAPGGGACFVVDLPIAAPDDGADVETPAERAPVAARRAVTSPRILICEDQASVLRVLVEGLKDRGFEPIEAGRAADALARLRDPERPIDLLITDVVLPDSDGVTLVRRAVDEGLISRAILMSGYTKDLLRDLDQLPGGVEFLEKPFTVDVLATAIRLTLEGHALPPRLDMLQLERPGEQLEPIESSAGGLLERYASTFERDFHGLLKDLRRAVRLNDPELLRRRLHTLSGLVGFFLPAATDSYLRPIAAAAAELRSNEILSSVEALEEAVSGLWAGGTMPS